STISYTASLAYYFAEMAAMELNYTKGQSERFVPSTAVDSRTLYDFSLIGLDLVLTFADRKDPFIPYIKMGLGYFAEKEVTYEFTDNGTGTVTIDRAQLDDNTFVPSVGFGLKIRLTKTMAFKFGIEAWTSDSLDTDPRWDWAGRAGISWFF
ncbi:MAG: outer membrane beta-barrel protein, partial [Pseudomonadota bacterium]